MSVAATTGTESGAELPRLALDHRSAAKVLGISPVTLWRRVNLPARDPRRIRRTTYGTYPVTELQRHLEAEMEA